MKTIKSIFAAIFLTVIVSCQKSPLPDAYHLPAILSTTNIEADGFSQSKISVILQKDAANRKINFTTTNGHFLYGTTTITSTAVLRNDSLLAEAFLISSQIETPLVRIDYSSTSSDRLSNSVSLSFIKAYPDSVSIQSSTASIQNRFNSTVPLDIYLLRKIGTPSLNQSCNLRALKDDDTEIGIFQFLSITGSDNTGLIKANFILNDTSYYGRIRIIGTVVSNQTNSISDTIPIIITH